MHQEVQEALLNGMWKGFTQALHEGDLEGARTIQRNVAQFNDQAAQAMQEDLAALSTPETE